MSTFKVPVAKRDLPLSTFHFDVARKPWLGIIPRRDRTYDIPVAEFLPLDLLGPFRELTFAVKAAGELDPASAQAIWEQWLAIFDRYAPGQRKNFSDDQIGAVLKAWQEQSTIALGESPASSAS